MLLIASSTFWPSSRMPRTTRRDGGAGMASASLSGCVRCCNQTEAAGPTQRDGPFPQSIVLRCSGGGICGTGTPGRTYSIASDLGDPPPGSPTDGRGRPWCLGRSRGLSPWVLWRGIVSEGKGMSDFLQPTLPRLREVRCGWSRVQPRARESGAEVMLDREVHGGGAPRLNSRALSGVKWETGQRWVVLTRFGISSDIARLGKARLRRRLPLRLARMRT
jgi:hypothetical protein